MKWLSQSFSFIRLEDTPLQGVLFDISSVLPMPVTMSLYPKNGS